MCVDEMKLRHCCQWENRLSHSITLVLTPNTGNMSIFHQVFVYGTLKRGEPNHSWILDSSKGFSKFLCEAETVDKYPLIIGTQYNIPFLLDARGRGHNVRGELYEVDESMLKHLDVLEDHPHLYCREKREVRCKSEIVSCWIYLIMAFRPELLKESHLVEYKSKGNHGKPYTERYLRNSSSSSVKAEIQNM